jgi:hypothetical protein
LVASPQHITRIGHYQLEAFPDRALGEQWQIADRFARRGTTWTLRDLVATNGAALPADSEFHQEHRLVDAPSPGVVDALMRLLFTGKKPRQRLTAMKQTRTVKAREERLTAYLRQGRLEGGEEMTT